MFKTNIKSILHKNLNAIISGSTYCTGKIFDGYN